MEEKYDKVLCEDMLKNFDSHVNLMTAVKLIEEAGKENDILEDLKMAIRYIDLEINKIDRYRRHMADVGKNVIQGFRDGFNIEED